MCDTKKHNKNNANKQKKSNEAGDTINLASKTVKKAADTHASDRENIIFLLGSLGTCYLNWKEHYLPTFSAVFYSIYS